MHRAAHVLDQRLDDGQADAGAFDRVAAFALHAEPVERLEQVLQLSPRHAAAGVRHAQQHVLAARQRLDAHAGRPRGCT